MNNPKEIIESFGRPLSDTTSVHTLTAFLEFAQKQMMKTTGSREERILRTDGYWYGAALFSYYGYDTVQEEMKKEKANSVADGSTGFADSPNREEEWNEIVTDVNTFETVSDSGTTSSGDSDSGSSCGSCSGCSS